MTDKLKQIIDKAEFKYEGIFNEFLIIPTGKEYDLFWGKNGFDQMLILAGNYEKEQWYCLTNFSDAFHLLNIRDVNFDVPHDLGCLRVFSYYPIKVLGGSSSVLGFPEKEALKRKLTDFNKNSEIRKGHHESI